MAAELQRDWRLPTGAKLSEIFHAHYPNYSLLIDSFCHANRGVVQAEE